MYRLGIFTGRDLKSKNLEFLTEHFGKTGAFYYDVVRGIDLSPVKPDRIPKSLSAEHTFSENISSEVFMTEHLENIATSVEARLKEKELMGKTVTLKIKYSDFSIQTRSKTISGFIFKKNAILEVAKELLYQDHLKNSVRLLGIAVSNLNTEEEKNEEDQKEIYVQLKLDF